MPDIVVTYPIIDFSFSISFPLTYFELEWSQDFDTLEDLEMLNRQFNIYGVFKIEDY